MVTLDMDHPDIEEYTIGSLPRRKRSPLVIGSTILETLTDMESIWSFEEDEGGSARERSRSQKATSRQ